MKFSILIGLLFSSSVSFGATLELQIRHQAGKEAFRFFEQVQSTEAGTSYRLDRLSYLISELRLQNEDGSWWSAEGLYGLVNAHDGDGVLQIPKVPQGQYQAIEWTIGVPSPTNNQDPAQWPAGHALNPVVNNMHWDWQGGYIFMALEGLFRNSKGRSQGFIYHLAHEPQLRKVRLEGVVAVSDDLQLQIDMQVPHLFQVWDMKEAASTHSREGDTLAGRIADRIVGSFRLVADAQGQVLPAPLIPPRVYPEETTPYALPKIAGVPQPKLPRDNPLTQEGVALGERLFNDKLLSRGEQISCASCHKKEGAFSDPGQAFSQGVDQQLGEKNSMPLFNLAWHNRFFWDGRAATLREQVLDPIENPLEMGETLERVEEKLVDDKHYPQLFSKAFGEPGVTLEKMALALEQFLLSITSFDSRFDRAMQGTLELNAKEKLGMQLFLTEFDPERGLRGADCFHCHGGRLFTNNRFFNNGLDAQPEAGLAAVSGRPIDHGKFKAPSLRNVVLTAPYMHDGRFETLEEVIDHYDHGVQSSATLDANLAKHPREGLNLTEEEKAALVAFLKTLTDPSTFRSKKSRLNLRHADIAPMDEWERRYYKDQSRGKGLFGF